MSSELKQEINGLRRMSREQLKDRWRTLYKAAPPAAFTPDLLARGIAWKLQERVLGGLSQGAKALIGVLGAGEREDTPRRSASRPWAAKGFPEQGCWVRSTTLDHIIEQGGHLDVRTLIDELLEWLSITHDRKALSTLHLLAHRHRVELFR